MQKTNMESGIDCLHVSFNNILLLLLFKYIMHRMQITITSIFPSIIFPVLKGAQEIPYWRHSTWCLLAT